VPIAIGLVVWALWRYPSRHTENIERRLTANSCENPVSSAAIFPDGRFLVYSDSTGLYQKLISTGETHSVPLPQNFSARVEGAHVLVTRVEKPEKPSLWNIPVFGGSPHKLTDDGSKASVSPDGSRIAFFRGVSENPNALELWVMLSDGTDQVRVASAYPLRVLCVSSALTCLPAQPKMCGEWPTQFRSHESRWRNAHFKCQEKTYEKNIVRVSG
jgi:hypothetical protein